MANADLQLRRLVVVLSLVLVVLASHVAGSAAVAAGANLRASARGRIICDVCNDGKYSAGTDRPIAGATVTVLCSASTEGSSDIVDWEHVAVSNSRESTASTSWKLLNKLFWLQQEETPLQFKVLSSHLDNKPKTKADKRVTVLARFQAQETIDSDTGGFVVDTSGSALQFFYSTVGNYPIPSRIYGVAQSPSPPAPQSPPFLVYEGGEFSGDLIALELDVTVNPKTMYWIDGTLSIRSGKLSVVNGATKITDVQTLIEDTSAIGLRAWQLGLDPVRKRLYALLDGPFPYGGTPFLGAFDISVNPPTRLFVRPVGLPISTFRDSPPGKFAINVYADPPVLYGVVAPPFSFGPPPSGQTWSLYKVLANLHSKDDAIAIAYGPHTLIGTESTAINGGDLLYGE
eukprot:jgi/Chlat1/2555/Chrsp175S02398